MNNYEMKGAVKVITTTEEIGEKKMKKRSIIIEDATTEYPKQLCIDFFGEKTKELDNISVWQEVIISYNPKVNEYKGKYYNSIAGRKIQPTQVATSSVIDWNAHDKEDTNSLPF